MVCPLAVKVKFEKAEVRVLRVKYGSHEKSVMHEHPPQEMQIFLTDAHAKELARRTERR